MLWNQQSFNDEDLFGGRGEITTPQFKPPFALSPIKSGDELSSESAGCSMPTLVAAEQSIRGTDISNTSDAVTPFEYMCDSYVLPFEKHTSPPKRKSGCLLRVCKCFSINYN